MRRQRLPITIWVLGFGSLFMDTASELIHSVLPSFMATTLGAPMAAIGLVEGVAEATASVTKVFSGVLSDRLRKRKGLMVFGYALAAATKPFFALAQSLGWVFAARFVDRVGKGVRGAPRDALVADVTPVAQRGAAYGLRQALDSVGAVLGPSLAMLCLWLFHENLRSALWLAVGPAVVTVLLLALFVREPPHPERDGSAQSSDRRLRSALRGLAVRSLPRGFWYVAVVGVLFAVARFSEAFLLLRGQNLGLSLPLVPAVMIAMNVTYAACAYPAGALADRVSRRALLGLGLALLVGADLLLANALAPLWVFWGAALWGLHLAFTQGLLSKLVADAAPGTLRGTAFGVFHLLTGLGLLLASAIAGAAWSWFGPQATFLIGAGFAALSWLFLAATGGGTADRGAN